jgi:hypothetical protein
MTTTTFLFLNMMKDSNGVSDIAKNDTQSYFKNLLQLCL